MVWLMIMAGGLLGAGHCLGMCGGFVLTLGSVQPSWRHNLQRQVVYALGRVTTYALGGALAGFGGWQLGRETAAVVHVQAVLSIVAGVLLVVQGLVAAEWLPWTSRVFGGTPCSAAAAFAGLLRARGLMPVFAAGVVNGLLPCGLVYAYLALASSTADMLQGAATMALFGLGTIPALVLAGLGGSVVQLGTRRFLLKTAAVCMILTGLLALGRGVGFLDWGNVPGEEDCPFCP